MLPVHMATRSNIARFVRDLRREMNPRQFVQEALEEAGQEAVRFDQAHPHQSWEDRSDELHESFEIKITAWGGKVGLREINTAEHASYVQEMEGRSVMPSFDGGFIHDMIQKAMDR